MKKLSSKNFTVPSYTRVEKTGGKKKMMVVVMPPERERKLEFTRGKRLRKQGNTGRKFSKHTKVSHFPPHSSEGKVPQGQGKDGQRESLQPRWLQATKPGVGSVSPALELGTQAACGLLELRVSLPSQAPLP